MTRAPLASRGRSTGLAPRWFVVPAILTLGLLVAAFVKTGFGVFGDGVGYYAPLRSLAFDGDLRIDDEVRRFGPSRWSHDVPLHTKFPAGMGLVLAPFFALGHVVAVGVRALGGSVTVDGYSWPYELAYCSGSGLFGLAGLVLAERAARERFGPGAAGIATLAVWFASPLLYYVALEPSMPHALSACAVAAFCSVVASKRWLEDRRQALLAGALLGLSALVRPQDALYGSVAVPLALSQARHGGRRTRRAAVALVLVTAGAAAVASLQLAVWVSSFGALERVPYFLEASAAGRSHTFDWLHPKLGQVLFSSFHGLFSWHPVTAVASAGLALLVRRDRPLAAGLAMALTLQIWVVGAWHAWWQGASFGGRTFSSASFLFVLGLAALWNRLRTWRSRAAAVVLLATLGAWNVSLAAQFRAGWIPGEAPVTLGRMAYGHVELGRKLLQRLAP